MSPKKQANAPQPIDLSKIKRLTQWQEAREAIESAIREVLGPLPTLRADLQVKTIDEFEHRGYVRRRVNYFVNEWERVSAWLCIPDGKDDVPALLCCHQTVPQGKDEPAGLNGDPNLAYAKRFAEMGYVTLAPDCITAGERVSPGHNPYDTAVFYSDNDEMSAMGKMLWDHAVALDVLSETKRVDAARLGVIGHSLGAYNAIFLAAFDERIQACAASCGFTRFEDDTNPERWARDEGFVHFPRLRPAIEARQYPFDWEHILALAAPVPILLLTALNDDIFPHTESCGVAVERAQRVYSLLGAPEAIENLEHMDGHSMPVEAFDRAAEWFEQWL